MNGSSHGYDTIIAETTDHVRTITLNRPERFNACSNQFTADLGDALKAAAADPEVRVVVITGAGKAFCSGQDLTELKERYAGGEVPSLGDDLRERYNPVIRCICEMGRPVIAAVNGIAAGAGCSLALACDMRIASEDAAFMEAFISVGLAPDAGSTYFLPRLIGHAGAMELCCTGRRVNAAEALRLGLVNRVVPADRLMEETQALAGALSGMSGPALAATKRLLNRSLTGTLAAQLDAEATAQGALSRTADHLEGVAAFIEKRKPRFTGK